MGDPASVDMLRGRILRTGTYDSYKKQTVVRVQARSSRYTIYRDKCISYGTYGVIHRAYDPQGQVNLAIKYMDISDSGRRRLAAREFDLMRRARHPNVIHAVATVCEDRADPQLCGVVMPYLRFSLKMCMTSKIAYTETECIYVAHSLLSALQYLHEQMAVIHGDVTPGNVLVNESDGRVVLADLGLTRSRGAGIGARQSSHICTIRYRAPELVLGYDTHGPEIDTWSVGAILLELANGRSVIHEKHYTVELDRSDAGTKKMYESILYSMENLLGLPESAGMSSQYTSMWRDLAQLRPNNAIASHQTLQARTGVRGLNFSADMTQLVKGMLEYAPNKRTQAAAGLQSPIFSNVAGLCGTSAFLREFIAKHTRAYDAMSTAGQHAGQRLRNSQQDRRR